MQSSKSMLKMLGLEQYTAAFEKNDLMTVSAVILNEESACSMLKTKRERDILQGYLRVREHQSPDAAELTEKRAAAFQLIRETLRKLSDLQSKKAHLSSQGSVNDTAELLDAIEDTKQALQLGQKQLEELTKDSQAMQKADQCPKKRLSRSRSSVKGASDFEGAQSHLRSKSPQMANETNSIPMPFTKHAQQTTMFGRPSSAAPPTKRPTLNASGLGSVRIDANNWNRNAPMTRVERMNRQYGTHIRPKPSLDGNDLCIVGSNTTSKPWI